MRVPFWLIYHSQHQETSCYVLLENGQSAVRDQLHNIMSMTMLLLIPTSSVCFAKVFFFALPLRECLGFRNSNIDLPVLSYKYPQTCLLLLKVIFYLHQEGYVFSRLCVRWLVCQPITQKLLHGFPQNLDVEWVSA